MIEKEYKVIYEDNFKKELRELSGKDQKLVLKKIKWLQQNPFHPSFRTKKMYVNKNYYESSINMDIRIYWEFEGDRIILLADIGHHDVVRKYNKK